jgi:hypothetical protein
LYWQLLRCFNLRRFGQGWAKNLADFVGNSSIIPTDGMSIAESRLGFLVTEAILTHAHRSIQSVHDRCIAMAECMQTRTGYPQTLKDRVQNLIHNVPVVIPLDGQRSKREMA